MYVSYCKIFVVGLTDILCQRRSSKVYGVPSFTSKIVESHLELKPSLPKGIGERGTSLPN